jgi:hypothetical protein
MKLKLRHKMISKTMIAFLFIVSISACDLFDLDINKDPNNPTAVTPELLLPSVMLNASSTFAGGLNSNTAGFVGAISSADDYNLSYTSYTGTWQTLYTGPLKDLDEVIKYCENAGNLPRFLGVAQILKAYYFSMVVDLWGDVPYFDAFNANNTADPNKDPGYDDAAAVYADLLTLIDAGIANLNAPSSVSLAPGDPIYRGNVTRWIKAANSLKLRLLINTRRVQDNDAAIATLLANPANLITLTADDMQFQFGRLLSPDNRHPWYQNAYTGATNNYTYFGQQMMYEMLLNRDPRWPFYFKRQVTQILNQDDPTERSTTPCSQTPGCVYGYIALNTGSKNVYAELNAAGVTSANPPTATELAFLAGIFGRDRGDRAGVPLDGPYRTAPGVYPAGGYFDDANPTTRKVANNGAYGNGIFPMITSSMVNFYKAEAILAEGVGGTLADARNAFEQAMRHSIAKVIAFGVALDATGTSAGPHAMATGVSTDTYVNNWLAKFDAASSNDAKLAVVLKQAWYTNHGNGYEIYNAFRRTGYPSVGTGEFQVMAPMERVRQFALRIPYSLDDLTLNANAPAEPAVFDQDAIFWDVIKFQF